MGFLIAERRKKAKKGYSNIQWSVSRNDRVCFPIFMERMVDFLVHIFLLVFDCALMAGMGKAYSEI